MDFKGFWKPPDTLHERPRTSSVPRWLLRKGELCCISAHSTWPNQASSTHPFPPHTIATLQNLSDDAIPPFHQVWRVTHPPLDMTLSVRWSSVGISGKTKHDRICEPSILPSCNRFGLASKSRPGAAAGRHVLEVERDYSIDWFFFLKKKSIGIDWL